jgi:hypothetical protein
VSYADIPLLGFAPDNDPAQPGSFQSCVGYESTTRGWKLARAVSAYASVTLSSWWPDDGFVSTLPDGTTVAHVSVYDGTATFERLYRRSSTSLTNATRASGGDYTPGQFSFSQWGNYTLATNLTEVLQIRDASGSSAFADSAATNIPKARICFTWGPPTAPRTMLLYYNDGTLYYDGWWTGHKGGPTLAWTASVANEAANGRLLGAGPLTAGIGFKDDAVAWSDNEMWYGGYLGTGIIVDWHKVANDVGCVGPRACCVANGTLYFVGKQGLFQYDGSYPRKVNVPIQKWLVNQIAASSNSRYIALTVDPSGQRLLLTLRTSLLGLAFNVSYALSINLLTGAVGMLPIGSGSGLFFTMLSYKYRLFHDGASAISIQQEGTSPITTTTNYIELARIGDDTQATQLTRVYPRFATAPTSFGVKYANAGAMSDTFTFNAEATTPVSVSPWRQDLVHTAKWHGLQIFTNSNGTQDPELLGLKVKTVNSGTEP